MISIRAGRSRPKGRRQTDTDKTPEGAVKTWLAPTGGLVTAAPPSAAQGAQVLDNFWPGAAGIEPRGGLVKIGAAPARVVTLFEYAAKGEKFLATATAIHPFTDTAIGAAAVTGLTSGQWSTFEVQNSGGSFLLAVNGSNTMRQYDGNTWTSPTITGVTLSNLSFVWGYRNRVFFVQKGTLSAWYLGTNAISGAATELPLSATFNRGGSLLAGATWSSDAGDGMDDRCAFITDQGEVAVFSGSDPGSVSNWSLEGVYYVGRILGPRAFVRIGGDLIFVTRPGLIPLSGAVQKDPAAMSSVSMAAPIEPDWVALTGAYPGDWRLTTWDRGGALFACPIGAQRHLVANLNTGAWMTSTGWSLQEIRQLGDGLYMSDPTGGLYRAWIGGNDAGATITCRMALAPDHLGDPAALKRAHLVRTVWRYLGSFTDGVSIGTDYQIRFPPLPVVTGSTDTAQAAWDTTAWDTSLWGSEEVAYQTRGRWTMVGGTGQALAPMVQMAVNAPNRPIVQLQRIDLEYTAGGVDL